MTKKTKKKNNNKNFLNGKKVLAVAGIAGIAAVTVACMGSKDGVSNGTITNTPIPTKKAEFTKIPETTITIIPTDSASVTITNQPQPTKEVTPTPVPTPALTVEQALQLVKDGIDTEEYQVQLINEYLKVGDRAYYQFGVISGQEFIYPFVVVDKADSTIYCYDSNDQTVFDFSYSTMFPIVPEATKTPIPTKVEKKELTAKEAYEILCTYSKESLKIAKEVKQYDAEYGDELTLIYGNQCYRINLSEVSGGKVRNRGEFYISVDGTKCYYIDSDTNEFILANK